MTSKDFEELSKDAKIVAYARFNKSKRLARKSWWSFFSITSLSVALILIAICDTKGQMDSITLVLINLAIPTWVLTTASSIVLLIISVAISLAKWDVENDKLNSSAIEINNLSRTIYSNKDSCDQFIYKALLYKYQEIIQSNQVNHDELDYYVAKWMVNKSKCTVKKISKRVISLIINYREITLFVLLAILSLIIDISLLKVIAK